ncbi:DUF6176 family protein [Streptoalloteichus hindustanus]|uniref:Uncharacterized protein n=1 Tax=Streptoalloteichus hindustanus TaxID=2017 RepID=A0A1M5ADC9_STRHI|nr:DUF6176 family protein [Streptoalloteichus hindustanus]SHF28144.1 hypothetical protein SAMN05444320_10367 [Streptoalloteichus hindustanus]
MQVRCVRIRLRAGTAERVRGFLRGWAGRRDEATESLRVKGVVRESMFLERTGDGDYLLLIQAGGDLSLAAERFATSSLAIDAETRQLLTEVSQHAIAIELLGHFALDDE